MKWLRSSWFALLALGCGPLIPFGEGSDGEDGRTDSSGPSGATTTVASSSTSSSTAPTSPPADSTTTAPGTTQAPADSDDGTAFVFPSDAGPDFECDLFDQDCRPGFKCAPYNNQGEASWNATTCVPLVEEPVALGEPCSVEEHPWSGLDDCGVSALCFWVDESTLEGTCIGLCIGEDESNAWCELPDHVCTQPSDGVGLCPPSCNPLTPDCGPGQACYPWSDAFICATAGTLSAGEDCGFTINECAADLTCVAGEDVPGCPGGSTCCTAYCTVGDPVPSCLPGQVCEPWYDTPPPGYEQVGSCRLP